ncbi:MAG TPA: DUF3179 domain-containing (seleno)protein [Oscillatoriaceae cyanobacterium]
MPGFTSGVSLAAAQGYGLLEGLARTRKHEHPPMSAGDRMLDATLAAIAVVPQLLNVVGLSPLLDRFYATPLPTLQRLYKARPFLEMTSLAAIGALALRARTDRSDGRWLSRGLKGVGALRAAGGLIASPALSPGGQGTTVVGVRELETLLGPDAPVVGLHLNGMARCYPLALLARPPIVHDTVGGVPVVVTYSAPSRSAIALHDDWAGQRLDLDVAGFPNDNLVLYERGADGMLQQLTASFGAGPNAGVVLETYPLVYTQLAQWRALHPSSTALTFPQGHQGGPLNTALGLLDRLDARTEAPLLAVSGGVDARLAPKTEVFALAYKGEAKAYAREQLRRQPVLNDVVGGEPVVVLYDKRHDVAAAYSRRLEGQTLEFAPVEDSNAIAEDQHHVRRDVAGRAVGNSAVPLRPFALTLDRVYWFAWAHFHPHTTLVDPRARAERR